jgi:hypothetical protein
VEAYLLMNLAPLPASVNKSVRDLDCGIKLGPTGPYPHYNTKHPYIEWLVDHHFAAISPASALDDQSELAPGSATHIGDSRIDELADLLEERL